MFRGAEEFATDAALRFLQERKAQYAADVHAGHGAMPLSKRESSLMTSDIRYHHGGVDQWSPAASRLAAAQERSQVVRPPVAPMTAEARPAMLPAVPYHSDGESERESSSLSAPPAWSSVAQLLSAKVEGHRQQLDLERGVREVWTQEIEGLVTHQLGEVRAVLRQLQEENRHLKKAVKALESRDLWRSGGPSPMSAGLCPSKDSVDNGQGEALTQRLQRVEEGLAQQSERWNDRTSRLHSYMNESVESAVAVELERVKSLARDTARQSLGELVRHEVREEQEKREAALREQDARLTRLEESLQLRLEGRAAVLQSEMERQTSAVREAVERVAAGLAALPTAESIVAQAEAKSDTFRHVVELQLQTAQRETERRLDSIQDVSNAASLSLRNDVLHKMEEAVADLNRRSLTREEASRLIESSVSSLKQYLHLSQATNDELKAEMTRQRSVLEAEHEALASLQRAAERQRQVVEALELQRPITARQLQEQAETLQSLKVVALEQTSPRVEELVQTVARMNREAQNAQRDDEIFRRTTKEALCSLREEHSDAMERLRHANLQMEEIVTNVTQTATACQLLRDTVDQQCQQKLNALEKKTNSAQLQLDHLAYRVEQTEQLPPSIKAAMQESMAQQQKDCLEQLEHRCREVQRESRAAAAERCGKMERLEEEWKRFQEDSALISVEDIKGVVDRALQPCRAQWDAAIATALQQHQGQHELELAQWRSEMQQRDAAAAVSPQRAGQGAGESPLLLMLQRQLGELHSEQSEAIERLGLEQDERAQRLMRKVDAEIERVTRRQYDLLQEEWRGAWRATVDEYVAQLPALLQPRVAAMVNEELTRFSPIRLVTRIAADEDCCREIASGIRRASAETASAAAPPPAEDKEEGGDHAPATSSAPPPAVLPLCSSSTAAGLHLEQWAHRLQQLEQWQSEVAPALSRSDGAVEQCRLRLDALEKSFAACPPGGRLAAESVPGVEMAALRAGLEAALLSLESRLTASGEERERALLAQLSSASSQQREATSALRDAVREETKLLLQPLTLQTEGLAARLQSVVEAHDTLRQSAEQHRHDELDRRRMSEAQWRALLAAETSARKEAQEKAAAASEEQATLARSLYSQLREEWTSRLAAEMDALQQRCNEALSRDTHQTPDSVMSPHHRMEEERDAGSAKEGAVRDLAEQVDRLAARVQLLELGDVSPPPGRERPEDLEESVGAALSSESRKRWNDAEARLTCLEDSLRQMQEDEEATLSATTSLLGELQESLVQCVHAAQLELDDPGWARLLEVQEEATATRVPTSLEDVFVFVLRWLGKAHGDVHTLHDSLLGVLDIIQEREESGDATAEEELNK